MSIAYLRNVNAMDNSALNKQKIENIRTEIIFLIFTTRERLRLQTTQTNKQQIPGLYSASELY
jgi:hypothetical protein